MEAVAIHSFKPTEPDEMGFEKGSILHIIEMEEDPNWYKARQANREGMVPTNYISLYPHPWYIPKCSRREAEARLLEVDAQTNCDIQPDGAFILRQSENDFGQFSISVKEGSNVLHYRVFSDVAGKYYIWNNKFQSINELIEYHRHQTIYGLKTLLLRDCVPSKTFGPVGSGPNVAFAENRAQSKSSATSAIKTGPREPHHSTSPTEPGRKEQSNGSNSTQFPPGIYSTHLAGRYCVSKFDFTAEFEGEMSFRRGDRIRILGEEDDNWWYAELVHPPPDTPAPLRGLIPANYVELLPQASRSSSGANKSVRPN